MAKDTNTTRDHNSHGIKGTPITATVNRLNSQQVNVELARYRNLSNWNPAIGDFIIWHGWWRRWYGVINAIIGDEASVITEGLPCLLFTLSEQERIENSIRIPIIRIRSSRAGEYHVMQQGTWYI